MERMKDINQTDTICNKQQKPKPEETSQIQPVLSFDDKNEVPVLFEAKKNIRK